MMHPLPMHSQSMIAAEAAMSANNQGKFIQMHNKLFENMGKLDREKILGFAAEIGLDVKKFTADFDGHVTKAEIDRMTQEVMKIGATGTPATFVNGRYLSGAQPYESFKRVVDEEIAKAKTGKDAGKEAKKTD